MKIIGWERKGNVVRFALGLDELKEWGGDDWNNSPYEHNALTVPLFGVEKYVEVAFPFEVSVMEPCADWHYNHNSPFCMDDFKERKIPIFIIDPAGVEEYYTDCLNKTKLPFIFMGDKFEEIDFGSMHAFIMGQY